MNTQNVLITQNKIYIELWIVYVKLLSIYLLDKSCYIINIKKSNKKS